MNEPPGEQKSMLPDFKCSDCSVLKKSRRAIVKHNKKKGHKGFTMILGFEDTSHVEENENEDHNQVVQDQHVEDTVVVLGHKCKKCSYRTSSEEKLKRHKSVMHTTSNKANAKVVQTLPTGEKEECTFCHKVYKNAFTMKRHLKAKHEDENTFDEAMKLVRHTRTACIYCAK